MKNMEEFIYLGSIIANNGKFTHDIEIIKAEATRKFGMLRRRLWGKRDLSLKVNLRILNAVVTTALMYDTTSRRLKKTYVR